jgi:drug/metabolite transporter (DMT)-like permease
MHAQSHIPLHAIRLGIGAGILAGSFWGLVFLAPILVPGFTPLQLSSGRYLAYGLVALVLIAPMWRRLLPRLGWREWRQLAWLSLCGNIVYYLFVAQAVQSGGGVMTAIVIGLLPLTVTLVGARDHGALPLRRLAPALLLGAAGLGCIAWQSLSAGGTGGSALGLACAVGALVSWTIYAVANSRCLARLDGVTAHEWSLLTGVMTGAQAVLLAVPAFLMGGMAALRRRRAGGGGFLLGARQRPVELRQPHPAPGPDRAADRVRDRLRFALWLCVGGALAHRPGNRRAGADGGRRGVLRHGAQEVMPLPYTSMTSSGRKASCSPLLR